jgi:hypothetical protein
MGKARVLALTMIAAVLWPSAPPRAQQPSTAADRDVELKPTRHPRVPADVSQLWFAPMGTAAARPRATADLAAAVKLEIDGDFAKALPIVSQPALQQGVLGPYAIYYQGFAELRRGRAAAAGGSV